MIKEHHEANRVRWEAAAKNWAENADSRGIWMRCHKEPELVFTPTAMSYLGEVQGKRVAVLGSGDNQAVIALAGMGAQVTSVDIAERQLEFAEQRCQSLGLSVDFVRADVTSMHMLGRGHFDLVFTGGHVAVWVSDIFQYYREAIRILKPGGFLLVEEYHPIRRIWKESNNELVVGRSYYNRGPYKYLVNDDVLYEAKGELESFEHHWTISDMINATIAGGAVIKAVHEYGEDAGGWERAPMQGLPEWLLVVGEKA